MCDTIVIRKGVALRHAAETLMRNIYAAQYGSTLQTFPSRIFGLINYRAEIICAAGVRLQDGSFLSERYLDFPIEQALSAASTRTIARSKIFEVTPFASRTPRATAGLIESVGKLWRSKRFVWSFFTLRAHATSKP